MLRGAIESCTPDLVSGWIHSENSRIRGNTVLAFIDDVCVGAGQVEHFRQDLADAGLGDGFLGFSFDVSVPRRDDASRIVVKLEGSDFLLLQGGCELASRSSRDNVIIPPGLRSEESLSWMKAQGWLGQFDFEFLKNLHLFGVYDVPLGAFSSQGGSNNTPLSSPEAVATRALRLLHLQNVDMAETVVSAGELANMHCRNWTSPRNAVVALWTAERSKILVVEGSHLDFPQDQDYSLSGAIHYVLGPDRLLFLDLRILFGVPQGLSNSTFKVFSAR